MTDSQILHKALEKTVKNGFDLTYEDVKQFTNGFSVLEEDLALKVISFSIIFSHDFAKAFWGEEWRKHLVLMVLEKKPLKYIEKFL